MKITWIIDTVRAFGVQIVCPADTGAIVKTQLASSACGML
jgi:hypothetical protein